MICESGYRRHLYWEITADFLLSISLGISKGDGTLHLGFDQHDNPLHYRVSQKNIATHPQNVKWTSGIFGPTLVSASPPRNLIVLPATSLRITFLGSNRWTNRYTSSTSPIPVSWISHRTLMPKGRICFSNFELGGRVWVTIGFIAMYRMMGGSK